MKRIKKTNAGFKICIILLIISIILTILVASVIRYTYNQLNNKSLSGIINYRQNVKTIDNDTYLDKYTVSRSADKPGLQYEDGVVSLVKNGYENSHLTYIYTGDIEFNYFGNYLWVDLVDIGRHYLDINVNNGFTISPDDRVVLDQSGWYTVFAVWYEKDGHKEYYVDNFNKAGETTKINTYNQWKANRYVKKSVEGVTNYLVAGISDIETSKTDVSNIVMLMSINDTTKEITTTMILKETYVYVPNIGCSRLVDVYNYGGIELLVKTVEENFGIKIDNYIMYDYSVFAEFIDSFGGMTVNLKSEHIEYMNRYITSYYEDHGLSGVERELISDNSIGEFKLNGIKTLAYISFKDTGFLDRNIRYKEVFGNIKDNFKNINVPFVIQNVLPRITTDVSYEDFLWLLSSHFDFINNYEFPYQSIPAESRVADFYVGNQYTVVLSTQEENTVVLNKALQQGNNDFSRMNIFTCLLIGVLAFDLVLVLLIVYFAFIKKYKIIYICENGQIPVGQKKEYRFMKNAHVYHQHFVPEGFKGMYADKRMTYEFTNEFKMPMRNIKVYVKCDK